jgi:antitoxin YefM
MEMLPLSEVKAHLSELVERVVGTQERILVTRNGRAVAVLISPDDLESLEETIAVMADPDLMASLRESEAAIARGDEGIPLADVIEAMSKGKQGLIDLEKQQKSKPKKQTRAKAS